MATRRRPVEGSRAGPTLVRGPMLQSSHVAQSCNIIRIVSSEHFCQRGIIFRTVVILNGWKSNFSPEIG